MDSQSTNSTSHRKVYYKPQKPVQIPPLTAVKKKEVMNKFVFLVIVSFLPSKDLITKISKLCKQIRNLLPNSILLQQSKPRTLKLKQADTNANNLLYVLSLQDQLSVAQVTNPSHLLQFLTQCQQTRL